MAATRRSPGRALSPSRAAACPSMQVHSEAARLAAFCTLTAANQRSAIVPEILHNYTWCC